MVCPVYLFVRKFIYVVDRLLRGYESELCNVAISTLESSRTVAQILHDIHLTDTQ